MDRRTFLSTIGASAITLALTSGFMASTQAANVRIIRELPSWGEKRTAWTVDDGTSPEAVKR